MNRKERGKMVELGGRVRVITRSAGPSVGETKSLPDDPFLSSYGGPAGILAPPEDPAYLASLHLYSPTLGPCIAAMAQNCEGFGFQLVARAGVQPETDEEKAEAEAEKVRLQDFFDYCNPEMSLTELRKLRRIDLETIGRAGWEVLRVPFDAQDRPGEIDGFAHIPSRQLRMCTQDKDATLARGWRYDRAAKKWVGRPYKKRFRRYAHMVGGEVRYFKEFGDPRHLDMLTGNYFTKDGQLGTLFVEDPKDLTPEQQARIANELLFTVLYDPGQAQGNPRWIGSKISLESAYRSEESAWDYLDNNGVPKLIASVLGGLLPDDAFRKLVAALEGTQGKHAENRAVVLEIVPKIADVGPGETARVPAVGFQIDKLNDLQRGDDAMLLAYDERANLKVRRSFRFNSLYLGENTDQSYATANVSMQINEQQVFAPERAPEDWQINNRILPELGARWWAFVSNGPALEDNTTWIQALAMAIESGAIPDYATLRLMLAEVLGYPLRTGDADGNPAAWEEQPPGFVKAMVSLFGALPTAGDIEEATQFDDTEEGQVGRSAGIRRSAGNKGVLVERLAAALVEAAIKARKTLAERAGEES